MTIPTTVGQPEAVVLASQMGHNVVWDRDPVLGGPSRWTCVACGESILDNGQAIYGPAKRERCGEVAS